MDDELASQARPRAVRLDTAAVHLDEPAHDRESDAEPAPRPLQRHVGLDEQVEYVREQLGREADAAVAHANDNFAAERLGR